MATIVAEGYHITPLVNLLQGLLGRLVNLQFKDIDIGARLPQMARMFLFEAACGLS